MPLQTVRALRETRVDAVVAKDEILSDAEK
jgi:hypothetical protein